MIENVSANNSISDMLTKLCTASGVSGEEKGIAKVTAGLLSRYGSTETDPSNNVICKVGEHDGGRKTLLLNAHIDEIGLIVTYITDDGFLRVSGCGGLDARVLAASKVTIYGKEKLCGVITSVPPHLQNGDLTAVKVDDLYIDTGLSGEKAKELISPGDRVLIENSPVMLGELITSKALDDRACIAVVILALDKIAASKSAYNIEVLFSSGEETGSSGAKTGAYKSSADLAITLDVTFARAHGESAELYCTSGKGAAIGISPVLSRRLSYALSDTAKAAGIPFQTEVMAGRTGTDADAIAVTKGGIPSCTVSVPIKYMHTPIETVDPADIENTAQLIAAFCERGLY